MEAEWEDDADPLGDEQSAEGSAATAVAADPTCVERALGRPWMEGSAAFAVPATGGGLHPSRWLGG